MNRRLTAYRSTKRKKFVSSRVVPSANASHAMTTGLGRSEGHSSIISTRAVDAILVEPLDKRTDDQLRSAFRSFELRLSALGSEYLLHEHCASMLTYNAHATRFVAWERWFKSAMCRRGFTAH